MKAYGGVDVYIQVILTLVLFGKWSASGLGLLTLGQYCSYAQLINYCAMKAYVGVDVYKVFLTPLLVGE
jgi:hypothetical protein